MISTRRQRLLAVQSKLEDLFTELESKRGRRGYQLNVLRTIEKKIAALEEEEAVLLRPGKRWSEPDEE